jgi:hypothetical protein
MDTFAAVIDSFGGTGDFAEAIAIAESHARTMKARDSIPPEYWPEVVKAAGTRRIRGITFEALAGIVAAKRGRNAR